MLAGNLQLLVGKGKGEDDEDDEESGDADDGYGKMRNSVCVCDVTY